MESHTPPHREDIVTPGGKELSLEIGMTHGHRTMLAFAVRKYEDYIPLAEVDDNAQEKYTSEAANLLRASELITRGVISAVANNHH